MEMRNSHGLWNVLSSLESSSSPKIAKMLKPFLQPITDCYECGVEVPTLNHKRETKKDISIAALFLKRSLNDLRATWDLLLLGYTSQAGSVAAAAFENALIVNCVAGDIDRAKRFLNYEPSGSPWSVAELCKIYSRQLIGRSKESGKPSVDPENETYWQVLYSQYMWLCKVKHPTIPSALHDAFSVSLDGDEYTIMAAPDTRVEDLTNKAFILSVTILRIKEAIESFALARELDYGEATIVSWKKRLDSIITNLDRAVDPIMKIPLPFDYRGRAFRKR